MECETSTQRVPFRYDINQVERLIIITSDRGNRFEYRLESLKDLYDWLKNENSSNWVLLGSINEQDAAVAGSVESWSRDGINPYGVTPGCRGRFASYIPAILAQLGFVELGNQNRNRRVRSIN